MHMIEFASGKKRYVKPDAQLVDFSLSANIAGACSSGGPTIDTNGWDILLTDSCALDTSSSEGCYHVPLEDNGVFYS